MRLVYYSHSTEYTEGTVLYVSDYIQHFTDFFINAGFKTKFSPKDKATMEFGIILKSNADRFPVDLSKTRLNTRSQTEVNPSIDLNQHFMFRLSWDLKLKYNALCNPKHKSDHCNPQDTRNQSDTPVLYSVIQ